MAEVRLVAEPRTEFGKGAARRVRRANKVPAVLYGHGQEPRHVSLSGHELMRALKGGANTLLTLGIDGGEELCLPRQIVRDPIKGFFTHVDLLLVRSGEKVTVDVSIILVGEAVREGVLDQQATTLSVEAEATHIPRSFEVSIDGMAVGDAVHAGAVSLPAGVTLLADPDSIVVQVLAPSVEVVEEEAAEAAASAEAAEDHAGDAAEAAGDSGDSG